MNATKSLRSGKIFWGYLCAIASQALFGLSFLFTKRVTESVTPMTLLSWRLIVAFIAMSVFVVAGVIKIHLKGRNIVPLLIIAILQPVIYFICETVGIKLTSASESGCIISCIPIVTLICSALILRDKPTGIQTAGIFVTMAGVAVCVLAKGAEVSFSVAGYLALFAAITSGSLYMVFSKKAGEFSSSEKTYVMVILGAIVFPFIAAVQNVADGTLREAILLPIVNRDFMSAILYLGIGCSVIAFLLTNISISIIGASRTASFAGIATVVSILAGVIVLGESFSQFQIAGTVLVIGGVYLANINRAKA